MLDALKTFRSEGWTRLELQTLTDVAECYRMLKEKEKLARILVQMSAFSTEAGAKQEKRKEWIKELEKVAMEMGKEKDF